MLCAKKSHFRGFQNNGSYCEMTNASEHRNLGSRIIRLLFCISNCFTFGKQTVLRNHTSIEYVLHLFGIVMKKNKVLASNGKCIESVWRFPFNIRQNLRATLCLIKYQGGDKHGSWWQKFPFGKFLLDLKVLGMWLEFV